MDGTRKGHTVGDILDPESQPLLSFLSLTVPSTMSVAVKYIIYNE